MKTILLILSLALFDHSDASAQGFLNRLKKKAEQIGEKVIDKTVDDLLNGQQPQERKVEENRTVASIPDRSKKSDPAIPPVNKMTPTDTIINGLDTMYRFNTAGISPREFISYAITLKGTPYSYGSSDPSSGLDCSGFITHVFNHFNISVPRRSYDFKNAEKKIGLNQAKPGDLILFTGANADNKIPGHMGIITLCTGKTIEFIHAASGKSNCVTTSFLSDTYFKARLLDIIRVF